MTLNLIKNGIYCQYFCFRFKFFSPKHKSIIAEKLIIDWLILFWNSWKCDHSFDTKDNDSKVILLCDKCHTIQALNPNQNYFELFGIKMKFDINLLDLNKCFKLLQMRTHPDKFTKKSQVSHP
jgi:hypothetical protein